MKQRHLQRSSSVSSPWQASFSTPWLTHSKEQKKEKMYVALYDCLLRPFPRPALFVST